jgi:hypothetical protein
VSANSKVNSRCRWVIIYIQAVQYWARTVPCGAPAIIFLGNESSPSTETLNFLLVKNDAISLTKIVALTTYIVGQGAMLCQRLLRYPRIQQPLTYHH